MAKNWLSFTNVHGGEMQPLLYAPEHGENVTSEWLLVGRDPNGLTYFDDDAEAMDTTNWQAIVDSLDSDNECEGGNCSDPDEVWESGDWFIGYAYDLPFFQNNWQNWSQEYSFGRCNIMMVRKDSTSYETVVNKLHQLADYPLLNEMAYSELESEAWVKCWDDWVKREVAEEVAGEILRYADGDDSLEAMAEVLEDVVDLEWDSAAGDAMSYYYGFSGEYDGDGARDGALAWIASGLRVVEWLARCGVALSGQGVLF